MLCTQGLESNNWKTSSLSWFENQWTLPEGCKKPRLSSRRAYTQTCLLLVTAWRKQIENYLGL